MFSSQFQRELTYLRELGQAFGNSHPAVASMLAQPGQDPDVERLLEGFAFLSAQLRQRVDDSIPELAHALAELLVPQVLRPVPSLGVVQLSAPPAALRGRHRVPRGAALAARPRQGTTCLFRTTQDVELLPLRLTGTQVDLSHSDTPVLRLDLQALPASLGAVLAPAGIRLFLADAYPVASTLLLWLLRHCREVVLRGAGARPPVVRLPPTVLQPVGFEPDTALWPWPELAPQGGRLVQEYFALPAKLLFVDVTGLDAAAATMTPDFSLELWCERPPPLPAPLGREPVRLHCTPVVNLFATTTEPVPRRAVAGEALLRAADVPADHMEVFAVDEVLAVERGRAERQAYPPYSAFRHLDGGARGYHRLRRARSPVDGGVDTYLTVLTPRDVPAPLEEATLSVAVTCTNRFLAAELEVGDVCVPTQGSPGLAQFTSITPMTRPVPPSLGAELTWRLLGHLHQNHRGLADAAALRELLTLHGWSQADAATQSAQGRRIAAVQRLQARPAVRVLEGAPVRGVHTTVGLDPAGFASVGDAFVLGAVLERLLAASLGCNTFHSLELHLGEGGYGWAPRIGQMPLI